MTTCSPSGVDANNLSLWPDKLNWYEISSSMCNTPPSIDWVVRSRNSCSMRFSKGRTLVPGPARSMLTSHRKDGTNNSPNSTIGVW